MRKGKMIEHTFNARCHRTAAVTLVSSQDIDTSCEYSWTNCRWSLCRDCLSSTEYRFCNGETIHLYECCEKHAVEKNGHAIEDLWFWQQQAANGSLNMELSKNGFDNTASLKLNSPKIDCLHSHGCNYSSGLQSTLTAPTEPASSYLETVREIHTKVKKYGCEDCWRKYTLPITEVASRNELESPGDDHDFDNHWYRTGLLKPPEQSDIVKNNSLWEVKRSDSNACDSSAEERPYIENDKETSPSTRTCYNVGSNTEHFESIEDKKGNNNHFNAPQTSTVSTDLSNTNSIAGKTQEIDLSNVSRSLTIPSNTTPSLLALITSPHLPNLSPSTVHNVPDPQLDPITRHCKACTADLALLDNEVSCPPDMLAKFTRRCNLAFHNVNGSFIHHDTSQPSTETSHTLIPFAVLRQHELDLQDTDKPQHTPEWFIERFWSHNRRLRRRDPETWKSHYLANGTHAESWVEPLSRHLRATGRLHADEVLQSLGKPWAAEYVVIKRGTKLSETSEQVCTRYRRVKDMTEVEAWW